MQDFSVDKGRFEVSALPADIGKFKVPSLRNVLLTPPYMHNGRFETLDEVLAHYVSGVKDSPTLDPKLKTDSRLGIALTSTEQARIIDFLKTLTDEAYIRDTRFAEQ